MANVAKFNAAGCGHMFKHYERAKYLNQETGELEYVRFHNQNIDPSKTHLNYNLAPVRFNKDGTQMSQLEIMNQRLQADGVYFRKRKDTNVMCSCVITKPKNLPMEESERFFQTAYNALSDRYGEENVISSYVHLDENEPHMHFSFVPVAFDVKKQRFTVSAKMKVCRTDLQTLHPYLTKRMKNEFGYDIGIENGATKEGNLTIPQLKAQQEQADLLQAENDRLRDEIKHYKQMAEIEANSAERVHNEYIKMQEEMQAEVSELKKERDNIRNSIKTTIKSKEEYDEAVERVCNRKDGFLHIVLDVFQELRDKLQAPENIWNDVVKKFALVIEAFEAKVLNLMGYEIKEQIPPEERKSEPIQNTVDSIVSQAKTEAAENNRKIQINLDKKGKDL